MVNHNKTFIMVEVIDVLGDLRCIRFESGRVGVVDSRGKVLLQLGNAVSLEFAEHGFVKVTTRKAGALCNLFPNATADIHSSGHSFFVDLKSKQMYSPLCFTYGKAWALRGPRKGGAPQVLLQQGALSSKSQEVQSPTALLQSALPSGARKRAY